MTSATSNPTLTTLQQQVWDGAIPLEIRLNPLDCRTYDESPPYLLMASRLSYLPSLLPTLHAFFTAHLIDPSAPPHTGYFTLDSIPLKWHYPLGLLHDLFSGHEPFAASPLPSSPTSSATGVRSPWKLTLHFSAYPTASLIPLDADGKVEMDAFVNSVKEADFLRNGTGKVIMSMARSDVETLWGSVKSGDRVAFSAIQRRFLDANGVGGKVRGVPFKVYLPAEPESTSQTAAGDEGGTLSLAAGASNVQPGQPAARGAEETSKSNAQGVDRASIKVVQGIIHPETDKGEKTTLGVALHGLLPSVFPSTRSYIHAQAVLHGGVVPLRAPVEELMRWACYADGFLHIAVVMFG